MADQFGQHCSLLLDNAIADGHDFTLYTTTGTNTLALQYLLPKGADPSRIPVYIARPTTPLKGVLIDVRRFTDRGLGVVSLPPGMLRGMWR